MPWVMTERKVISVLTGYEMHGGVRVETRKDVVYYPGDVAPSGHEGRSYTRMVEELPNRMFKGGQNR